MSELEKKPWAPSVQGAAIHLAENHSEYAAAAMLIKSKYGVHYEMALLMVLAQIQVDMLRQTQHILRSDWLERGL